MKFGVSVLLMAVGAILTFATNTRVNDFDLDNIGVILMIAGALSLIISAVVWAKGRTTVVTRPIHTPPLDPTTPSHTVEERRTYRSPTNP